MEYIRLEKKDGIEVLTIDRPGAFNALNMGVLEELDKALEEVEQDAETACVIITGAGEKAFVAGADIAEMRDMTPQEAYYFGEYGSTVFDKIEKLGVPVIAAVNGYALGGGMELAMACDIRLASENAVFAQPEVSLGITPGFGGTQRLPRCVGEGRTKELLFTGRNIKADEALAIGLVQAVIPKETLADEALKLAKKICLNARAAVALCKKAVSKGMNMPLEEGLKEEHELFSACFSDSEQKTRMTDFLRKH